MFHWLADLLLNVGGIFARGYLATICLSISIKRWK